jgi:site-specific recombinase XerC
MINLPNNCKCSQPTVSPANWKQSAASIKAEWCISYYFYDPNFYKKRKYIVLKKGINSYKSISERRAVVAIMLDELLHMLINEGWNPIFKTFIKKDYQYYEIDPATPFIEALEKSFKKLSANYSKSTNADIKSMMHYLHKSAIGLRISHIKIADIKRKNIKLLLENCKVINPTFSENRYNKYRSYLQSLFKELVELEAIEHNPINDLGVKKTTKNIRQTLTNEERKIISEYLKLNHYAFWRFIQIFFHSGARLTELMSIQKKDVDFVNQKFKVLIKKGSQKNWQIRTIKDVALGHWTELLQGAKENDFIFSVDLKPGAKKIDASQITRRWKVHVKYKLGVTADLYSLKHTNLDETSQLLDIESASKMAGHTTTTTTAKYYLINEKERLHEKLKGVNNEF